MSDRTSLGHAHFDTLTQLQTRAQGYEVQSLHWEGSGRYYLYESRNVYDRSVIEAVSAVQTARELTERIRDLALDLADVRAHLRGLVPSPVALSR